MPPLTIGLFCAPKGPSRLAHDVPSSRQQQLKWPSLAQVVLVCAVTTTLALREIRSLTERGFSQTTATARTRLSTLGSATSQIVLNCWLPTRPLVQLSWTLETGYRNHLVQWIDIPMQGSRQNAPIIPAYLMVLLLGMAYWIHGSERSLDSTFTVMLR